MAFGLTAAGFKPKRIEDVTGDMQAYLRAKLGDGLAFAPTDPVTQLLGALAERFVELWEEAERVHLSRYPDTAQGVALGRVGSLNLLTYLPETRSRLVLRLLGAQNTAVSSGDFEASVDGNPAARFRTEEAALLVTPYNAIQSLAFNGTPASGSFTLTLGAEETAAIAWDDAAADLEAALEGLAAVGAGNVDVTGSFAAGFEIEFKGALASTGVDLLAVGANTLQTAAPAAVAVTVTEDQAGGYGDDVECTAVDPGPLAAPAGSCTVIETPTAGVERVFNPAVGDVGSLGETEAEFRLRRAQSLQRPGTAPLNGIRAAVADVENVDTVFAFENETDDVDGEGRPPHSVEIVVQGGVDLDIAKAIWASKAGGIQTFGTEEASFVDDFGQTRTIHFSRPEEVEIYMEVDVVPNTDPNESDIYPADGDDLVKAAILAFADANQPVGRDVITVKYFIPVNQVPGVNGIVIRVGTSPSPAGSANVVITARQRAVFALARITVDSTP
jgi:uncharacterized phage protein gp47/JayE